MLVVTVDHETLELRPARFDDICEAVLILVSLIPIGKVSSYSDIGRLLGAHPRLVAQCLMRNKNPMVIPCHRVVRKNGRLGGYSFGGVKIKAKILSIEGALGDSDKFGVPKNAFFRLDELLGSAR
ncbi:MGMT family protein [Thermosphaera aggregans]|uniref:Methylated-DNA/protein-cysteinemethyltransferase n=1 Tax=Thermosphaera aggregans (strain DSM 11486 / M11TL) TaxID=633148 RepID=D5U179_THEAM|nr:MGMT family protein [Thermosphaera aggregans]ADG90879.1 methylated-DNA/protein-cysteinemethyltransferase [Thermosphaera aggregans DSM 11486]